MKIFNTEQDESSTEQEDVHQHPKKSTNSEPKLMEDVEEANPILPKTIEASENDKDKNKKSDTGTNNTCDLILDVFAIVCLFIMSFFFICGTSFVHPGTDISSRPDEPYAFIVVGTLFHIAFCSIDLVKRTSKGVLEIVAGSISIFSAVLWFVASIFLLEELANTIVWGGIWIIGCLLNLYVFIFDLVVFFRGETKPLFRAMALFIGSIANVMFLAGAGHMLAIIGDYNESFFLDIVNVAGWISHVFNLLNLFYLIDLQEECYSFGLKANIYPYLPQLMHKTSRFTIWIVC